MELVDIYNEKREPLGYTKVKWEPLAAGEFILIAHLVIFNSRGEMLIQKRNEDKLDWPGCWDITSGGGVIAGETSDQAACREIQEELGLHVELADRRPLLTVGYPLGFDDYYILELDVPLETLQLQEEEVLDAKWADHEEICRLMAEGKFVRYKKGFVDLLFALRSGRGSYDA